MKGRRQQPQSGSGGPSDPTSPAHPPRKLDGPVFAQPQPTEDPSIFRVKHPSDDDAYKAIDELNREGKIQPMPFPMPRG
jgi:hypothetical protein